MSIQPIPTASAEVPSSQVSQLDLSVSISQQDILSQLIRSDALNEEEVQQMLDDALSWIAGSGPKGKRYLNDIFQHHMREVLEQQDIDEDIQEVFIALIESLSPSPF
jgi:hypothetical protein